MGEQSSGSRAPPPQTFVGANNGSQPMTEKLSGFVNAKDHHAPRIVYQQSQSSLMIETGEVQKEFGPGNDSNMAIIMTAADRKDSHQSLQYPNYPANEQDLFIKNDDDRVDPSNARPNPNLNETQPSAVNPNSQTERDVGQGNLPPICFVQNPNGGYSRISPPPSGMAPDMDALDMYMRQQEQFRRNFGPPPAPMMQGPMYRQMGPAPFLPGLIHREPLGMIQGGLFQGPSLGPPPNMHEFMPGLDLGLVGPDQGQVGMMPSSRMMPPPLRRSLETGQVGGNNMMMTNVGPQLGMDFVDPMMMGQRLAVSDTPNNFQGFIPQSMDQWPMDCYLVPQARTRSKVFDPMCIQPQSQCSTSSRPINVQLAMNELQQQLQSHSNPEQRITLIREVYHFKKAPRVCSKRQAVDCSSITSCRPQWTNAYSCPKPNCVRRKTVPKCCPQDCCSQKKVTSCKTKGMEYSQVFIEKPKGCTAPTTLVREFVLSGRGLQTENKNNYQVATSIPTTMPPGCLFKGNSQLNCNLQDLQALLLKNCEEMNNPGRTSQGQNQNGTRSSANGEISILENLENSPTVRRKVSASSRNERSKSKEKF